jgi:hypothetical protein
MDGSIPTEGVSTLSPRELAIVRYTAAACRFLFGDGHWEAGLLSGGDELLSLDEKCALGALIGEESHDWSLAREQYLLHRPEDENLRRRRALDLAWRSFRGDDQ